MADRENRGCYCRLLNRVAVAWNAAVETQAISTLDDSDAEAAASAAHVLAEHGKAGVEPHLWKRLERWLERRRGRAAELEVHPITAGCRIWRSNLDLLCSMRSRRLNPGCWTIRAERVFSVCALTIGAANSGAGNSPLAHCRQKFPAAAGCIPRRSAWIGTHPAHSNSKD